MVAAVTRLQVFRLFFSIRRHDLGVFGAAKQAVREALRPTPF
jgi:hypothetical protein